MTTHLVRSDDSFKNEKKNTKIEKLNMTTID